MTGRIVTRLRRRRRPPPTFTFESARPFVPDRPVIIEAGASIGMDVPELLRCWPRATVHAFEPEPTAYAELERRVSGLAQVTAWNLALGRVDGEVTLNVSRGEYGTMSSSLLTPTETREAHPDVYYEPVSVRQQTLSSWAEANHVKRVDLLALDMQGFERDALDASRDIVRTASVVMSETFLVEMYAGNATVDQLQALLTEEGFVILQTQIIFARTFEILAVSRAALQDAIYSGRLATRGSAGSLP